MDEIVVSKDKLLELSRLFESWVQHKDSTLRELYHLREEPWFNKLNHNRVKFRSEVSDMLFSVEYIEDINRRNTLTFLPPNEFNHRAYITCKINKLPDGLEFEYYIILSEVASKGKQDLTLDLQTKTYKLGRKQTRFFIRLFNSKLREIT